MCMCASPPSLYGRDYMEGFGLPYALVLGNHDLEGDEFDTDQDNLAAWEQVGERMCRLRLGVLGWVGGAAGRFQHTQACVSLHPRMPGLATDQDNLAAWEQVGASVRVSGKKSTKKRFTEGQGRGQGLVGAEEGEEFDSDQGDLAAWEQMGERRRVGPTKSQAAARGLVGVG